ncbi:hypothetical protein [Aneurinibacillus migulanus]|uniref:hypothetical protein n=1 Tax=Aneurinibacillus migulanus TaxID=47500 RepID=UPI001F2B6C8A|nr:hypothetical protein [Aneurinibacillus migulanus]
MSRLRYHINIEPIRKRRLSYLLIIRILEVIRCTCQRVGYGCFAVLPGWGKKRLSRLSCGRRTDVRLEYGVVAIQSEAYRGINTLKQLYNV